MYLPNFSIFSLFTYRQNYYGNSMVERSLNEKDVVAASIEKQITLTDDKKITYHSKVTQLDFDKLLNGVKAYTVIEEDGYGLLCQ